VTRRTLLRLYAAGLALAAAATATTLITRGFAIDDAPTLIVLAIAAIAVERWSLPVSATTQLSVYLLPTVFAAVVLGPLSAAVVGAAAMLGDIAVLKRPTAGASLWLKWLTYSSTGFITGALTGLVAETLYHPTPSGVIAATFAAMALAEALDLSFATLTGTVRGAAAREVLRRLAPVSLTSVIVFAPFVVILTMAYLEIARWALILFLGSALALHRLYCLYQRERRLTDDLRSANDSLARANLSFAGALVATLDARDRYTAGHSAAVAIYSRDIAVRMGLAPDLQERAYLCGLVHDIGKIGLPPGLLEKEGPLTLAERRMMQEHSAIGERILVQVDDYSDIAEIVRHHHERVDGEGYPDGLQADAIPLVSRIIAVADAYNAMTSDRPYRDAMPSRVARLRLAQAVDSQLDTAVVAAFEAVLTSRDEDYRMARTPEFSFFGDGYGEADRGGSHSPSVAISEVA
jgi:HD-GYP domain-containing protein (c-di-GMP phosphodiesterase class II)